MNAEYDPLIPVKSVGITFNLKMDHSEEEEEYDPLETIRALRPRSSATASMSSFSAWKHLAWRQRGKRSWG
ncbi:MAG: hypothetical protein GX436_09945 [Synergistaceae bacterium]|nr:hypothetical protein [Synergistaceae bacterium]